MAVALRNRSVKSVLIAAAGAAGLCLAVAAPLSAARAQMVFGMGAGAPPADVGAPSPFAPPAPEPAPWSPNFSISGNFAR